MYTSQQELNISKLFSHPVQYKVPHYQRWYVWNKTNWRTLWEDILAQCQDSYKEHFTGSIVTREISKGEPEIFEVIDGQQRLTTFQIILCVIRDILVSKEIYLYQKVNL